jgi:hypothetical protein
MPWIEANTEAINRNPDLEKYNIMAAIAEVKEIKANMSTPVIPENNTSYAVRKTLEADMDQADNLYKQGRFGQAKEIYDKIALTAASEYDRLNALKNKLSAGKDSPMMRYFSAIADIAKKRSADAQQHAVTTEHFEVYKKFLDEINSLNNEAITENKTNDYQAASEHLAAIYKLINDNIDNMRKQLENVQGVADDKGNPVSAQELIENLSKAADKAKENQNIVLNNLLNSLISRCDHLLKYPAPDKSKMKGEMMSIAKEAKEILDSQGKDMNTELKGKFNKLIGLIYRDSAMVIPIQPVGGIDFNSKNLDLQIEGDIGSFALSVDPAVWDNIKVQGLVPTIIEIKPVTDWGVF